MSGLQILISEVLGNYQRLDGGSMFGNAPRAVWERWTPVDEKGRILLACRALLLEVNGTRILFETGIGSFFEPKMAERFGIQDYGQHSLLENLSKLGLSPNQIDWVILSHLHFDHAGGLLPTYENIKSNNNKFDLVFTNANYVVGQEAFSRSQNPHSRDKASFIPGLNEKLIASQRLYLVKENAPCPIFPEIIEFIFTSGHTPGHMHALIHGESSKIFFAGDLVPGIPWVHLPITMGYDRFPEKVIDEKEVLYQRAIKEKWRLFYTHDPEYAISEVELDEKGLYKPTSHLKKPTRLRI